MAQLTRINSLGLVNFHTFAHKTTGAIVWVECTDREYADLGVKGGGPPPVRSWPAPERDYIWKGSAGGADKFAEGKYMPDRGEMYFRNNRYYIQPHDEGEKMVVTDPTRDTISGDPDRSDTTITITPDPVRPTGGTWRVVDGDLSVRV